MAFQWRWTELIAIINYFGGRADRLDDEQVGRTRWYIKGDNWVRSWVEDDAIQWAVYPDSQTEEKVRSHDVFGAVLCSMWHSSDDVKDSGYVNLKINEELRDGGVIMGIMIMKMPFKTDQNYLGSRCL